MPKRYWYVILTYIVMQFSGIIIGYPLLLLFFNGLSEQEAIAIWTVISFPAALGVILLLMKRDIKTTPAINPQVRESDNRPDTVGHQKLAGQPADLSGIIKWSVLGVILAFAAQYIAAMIEFYLLGIKPGSENTEGLMEIVRTAPIFIVVPALFAPILEEIIFRKIIFGSIYKRTNFLIAAILSALIFSVVHTDFTHTLVYTSMGLVFAFLFVKTKRIIVPIIAHMAMNTFVVIAQYKISPEDVERMQKQLEQLQTIFIGG